MLVLLSLFWSLAASDHPAYTTQFVVYNRCLIVESAKLEQSEAAFYEIFLVAKDRCASEWAELYEAVLPETASFIGKYANLSQGRRAFEFIEELEEKSRRDARSIVLSMRADRNRRESYSAK